MIIGGDEPRRPWGYISKQQEVNSKHLDGSLENQSDYDSIWDIFDELDHVHPKSALSVGCRSGYELRQLRRTLPKAKLMGVDIVPGFIEAARAADTREGTGATYEIMDMHNLYDIWTRAFDLVICSGTLEHAYNVRLAVSELQRVCNNLLYVTADLTPEIRKGSSDYTASPLPSDWLALFESPSWQLIRAWTQPGCVVKEGLFMIWRRRAES